MLMLPPSSRPLSGRALLLAALSLGGFLPSGAASAATLTVTNTNDSGPGSLRQALTGAADGDFISFDSHLTGPITLTGGALEVPRSVTLRGPVFPHFTINGNGAAHVFHITGSSVVLSGLVITGGDADGGNGGGLSIESGAALALSDSEVQSNQARSSGAAGVTGAGGGIYNLGSLTLYDCVVGHNEATGGYGAGIYSLGPLSIGGSQVSDNGGAGAGGGLYLGSGPGGPPVSITGTTLSGNSAEGPGGCILNHGPLTLLNCTLSGNSASSASGGALYNAAGGVATLTGCTVAGNTATGTGIHGGGVYNEGALSLTDCTVAGNSTSGQGGGGGGVYSLYSGAGVSCSLTSCTVTGNQSHSGDGVGGPATITASIIVGNTTYGGGSDDGGDEAAGGGSNLLHGDPGLDPAGLKDNGGPTQTIAVLPGSRAIGGDLSGATATDQRGVARTAPQHTIGAFEYPAPTASGHTHLLWNNSDSRVMFWSVAPDGSFTLSGFGPYTDDYVSSDPNNKWHATALAAAPDGTSRIVWNNVDHRVMLWSLDASGNVLSVTGYGPYTDTYVSSSPGNLWSAVGVSVGPDGLTHLLWGNTDRRMMFWDLDAQGNLLGLTGYGPYTDDYVSQDPANVWSAAALATGPDNVSRVVWNNVDHRVMLWTLGGPGGSSILGIAGYGPYTDDAPQNLWSAVGVSVGPDDVTHLLWSNTDRRAMFWDVDSSFGFTLAGYGPYTDDAPGNLWTATALATGPDGLSHILWNNTDDRAMLWGVDNSFRFTLAGYGPYTDNAPGNLWGVTAVSAGP